MPTGPEHYKEAERLDALAYEQWGDSEAGDPCPQAMLTAQRAQTHALLAVAAAVAAPVARGSSYAAHDKAWREAAGHPADKRVDPWDLVGPSDT